MYTYTVWKLWTQTLETLFMMSDFVVGQVQTPNFLFENKFFLSIVLIKTYNLKS